MSDFASAEISAKLDRERVTFLRTEVSLSFTFAETAETEYGLGEQGAAARSLAHGEEGYATLCRFLSDPKHASHLTGDQLQELTDGANSLRQKLDEVHRLHTRR
jgi:hypothetical protein